MSVRATVGTADGSRTKCHRVESVLIDILGRHAADPDGLPTTARFLFYELEQTGNATKPDPSDTRPNRRRSIGWPPGAQDITDGLTRLRNAGRVPWDWIADTERSLLEWGHAPTVVAHVREHLAEATISPWGDEPPPLLLTESNGMAQVLHRVAAEHCCPIGGTKGMVKGWLLTEVVPLLLETGCRKVLYLGDLDRPGLQIEANTRRVIEDAIHHELDWTRIGVTEAQAEAMIPILKTDGRTHITSGGYEVEALGQAAVVALVRDALTALLPEPLADVRERAEAERRALRVRLEEWTS